MGTDRCLSFPDKQDEAGKTAQETEGQQQI